MNKKTNSYNQKDTRSVSQIAHLGIRYISLCSKNIYKFLLTAKIALFTYFLMIPSAVFATNTDPSWEVKTIFGVTVNSENFALEAYLSTVLNAVYGLIGSITLFRIIYGSYKYMNANGNANDAREAKQTIIHALTGLFLVLAAFLFTRIFISDTNNLITN